MSKLKSFFVIFLGVFLLFIISDTGFCQQKKLVTLDLEDANVIDALKLLSSMSGLNIVADESVKGRKITISLKKIDALDALDLIVSATGLTYQITEQTIIVATMEKLRQSAKGRTTEKIQLYYMDVIEAKDILSSYISSASDLQVNIQTNEIMVTDVTSQMKKIKEVIAEIDTPPKQIMLEAKVVEVSSSDLKELGFNWSSALTETILETVPTGTTNPKLTDPISFARTPTLQLTTILSFLTTEGKGKILASPKIATLNKKEAIIEVTDQVPYAVRSFDAAGRETITMSSVSAGVSLKITPQINVGGYITVKIKPRVSSVIEFTGPGGDFPRLATREAETIVRVRDGETIVLGGLNKNEERETIKKIPLLGDIPLLGLLFKNRRMEKINTEVLIFITPHILKEPILTK